MVPDSRERIPLRKTARYALALILVLIALWIELALTAGRGAYTLAPFSLAVAVSAWSGGVGPGVFALIVSLAVLDYYLIEPGTLTTLGTAADVLAIGLYTAGWLIFCGLIDRMYRQGRQDRRLRLQAERVARQADRLAQLTAALGQARTPAAVVEASVQEPLHSLKADAGMLLLIEGDGQTAELARAVAFQSEDAERWQQVVLAGKSPVADAVGRGAPVIVETRDRWLAEYRETAKHLYGDGVAATVAVPLVIGSRVVAVVRLDFAEDRPFSADDREYLFALGPRAAQALDRTWEYEHAQRARIDAESLRARADQELAERQKIELALRTSEARYRGLAARTSRLHGLTAALSEAVTLQAVAQAVVHQGKIVVGATSGEVTLVVDGGKHFECMYAEEGARAAETRRFPAESGLCATEVIRTGRPVFVGSFEELQERYWRSASIAADGGYVSSATLPLLVENTSIGVLAFHFTAPVNFDDDYRALLISVAQHCAQALDRARLYESAQRARAEAETANRLKDEFVSIVSHELRTPLNAMLGWTAMLQKGSLEPHVAGRALQSIHDNATRQARLIDELLDFSRLLAGRTRLDLEEIDLRDLIRGVVESMIPTAAATRLELRLSPIPPVVIFGDIRRLEQVFFNLLSNALKFTPAGGQVAIDARLIDGMVEVRVIDNGVGIEAEFLPHAFDRFRQADTTTTRSHGGLGLGLSIARQLVEAHKGSIAVESPGRDQGSTFTVRLPVQQFRTEDAPVEHEESGDSGSPEETAATSALGPRLDGIRVLVVDDEADTREIMSHALQGCGAEVTLAASARDALAILEHTEMDVLLADIAMPEEDGYSLIKKVRTFSSSRVASIPAAAVTAHARDEERRRALAAGYHLHVAKPFEPAQLAQAVERLVRGNSLVH